MDQEENLSVPEVLWPAESMLAFASVRSWEPGARILGGEVSPCALYLCLPGDSFHLKVLLNGGSGFMKILLNFPHALSPFC
jgi:hypothetical protein